MDILASTFAQTAVYLKHCHDKGMVYATALYKALCQEGRTDIASIPIFDRYPALAHTLQKEIVLPSVATALFDQGNAAKFITPCKDGELLESVIIPHKNRTTLCVSSQLGCRMGCTFCTTGLSGFGRNATTAEIVGQLFTARFVLKKNINNLVLMGMGEPLDNIEAVIQAIRVFSDQRGFSIPLRSITVSTAGHVEGLRKLAAANLPTLKIAISLNSANNAVRSRLMPINKQYGLPVLKEALMHYPRAKRSTFLIEYVLLDGINDSFQAADELAQWVADLPVRINVIGFNPGIQNRFKAPSHENIRLFCNRLAQKGLFVRERKSYGSEIGAACGQLRGQLNTHPLRFAKDSF